MQYLFHFWELLSFIIKIDSSHLCVHEVQKYCIGMENNITYSIFLVILYFRDVSTRKLKRFSKFNALQ